MEEMLAIFRSLVQFFWPSVLVACLFAPVGVLVNRASGPKALAFAAVGAWLVSWLIYWLMYGATSDYGSTVVRDHIIRISVVAGLPVLVAGVTVHLLAKQGVAPGLQVALAALVGSGTMPVVGFLLGAIHYLRTGSWL